MTIMTRLYVLVGLAIAPSIALLAYNDHADLKRRDAEARTESLRYAKLVSGELDRLFEGARTVLWATAQAPLIQSRAEPECGAYLRRLQEINPSTTTVSIHDVNGQNGCSNIPPTNLADRAYFQQAAVSDDFVVGEYTVGKVSGQAVLPFAQRIKDRQGQVRGVMVTTLRMDWLRAQFAAKLAEFPPQSSLTIIDKGGTILVRLPKQGRDGTRLSEFTDMLRAGPAGGTFQSEASQTDDGVARMVGYVRPTVSAQGIVVALGIPVDTALAGVAETRFRNFLLMGFTLLLAHGAAWAGGRVFVLRPMSDLLTAAEKWRTGDLSTRMRDTGDSSEFRKLGVAFNSMAAELEQSLQTKDMLLQEMSHRVMNSLATISGLFSMQARAITDTEARTQFTQAVTRINSMALAYRRMHTDQGIESIECATLLKELCANLHRSMLPDATPCMVEADPLWLGPDQATSLALIVNELLTNAVKHGADGSVITVKLGRSTEGCRLAVRNFGTLPPRYDPSQTSGFGLRMVLAMVKQLDGRLEASTMSGETEFAVTFEPKIPQPTVLAVVQGGTDWQRSLS